jgi:hypothetical protein
LKYTKANLLDGELISGSFCRATTIKYAWNRTSTSMKYYCKNKQKNIQDFLYYYWDNKCLSYKPSFLSCLYIFCVKLRIKLSWIWIPWNYKAFKYKYNNNLISYGFLEPSHREEWEETIHLYFFSISKWIYLQQNLKENIMAL